MIISRTPFRISFFGGGTDYPGWYRRNGGAVLSTTIDKYCYLTCRYLPPFFEHRSRIVWSQIEHVKETAEIQHPAVREILDFLDIQEGVEIHHVGDLPARSGLGSSSAFAVGLLNALYALKSVMPSKRQLALDAVQVEQELLRDNVGSQDQISAAFGGLNRINLGGDEEFSVSPVILPGERLESFQDRLMLFFTGLSRNASDIAGAQIEATNRNQNHNQLTEMHQMVEEATGILSGNGDLEDFGRMLHETWQLKRSLTDRISSGNIDEIYESGMAAGATGGKLLGAGGGGFMLFFAKPELHQSVKDRLKNLLHVPFKFESNGSQIIFYEPQAEEREVQTPASHRINH